MVDSLLPPNSTTLETALEELASNLLSIDVPVDQLWSPERVPAALLGYLAWALSVDEWDSSWAESRKRSVIADSVMVHRRKGTPWAVKRTLELMGYGTADLTEYATMPKIGDAPPIGGDWYIGWSGMSWADYIVTIKQPIKREDADRIEARLASVAPARCRLWKIIVADGVYYAIGDGLWTIGADIVIGGSYNYEVQTNA
jgi:phage tail protein, P2 protein I family